MTVTGNNSLITFDEPGIDPARVFAPDVATGYREIPPPPTRPSGTTAPRRDGYLVHRHHTAGRRRDPVRPHRRDSDPARLRLVGRTRGGSITFTVAGTDVAGDPVDTRDVVLTSSISHRHRRRADPDAATASPHTITATLGTATTSTTIQVIPAAAPTTADTPTPAPISLSTPTAAAVLTSTGSHVPPLVRAALLVAGTRTRLRRTRRRRHPGSDDAQRRRAHERAAA